MDPLALNYFPGANVDDSSCYYSCNVFSSPDTTICLGLSITMTPLLNSYTSGLFDTLSENFNDNTFSLFMQYNYLK